MKSFINNKYPFLLSFFGPIVIMLAYFIARHMYPFGSSTILTVDLGQQYVDFFAFLEKPYFIILGVSSTLSQKLLVVK